MTVQEFYSKNQVGEDLGEDLLLETAFFASFPPIYRHTSGPSFDSVIGPLPSSALGSLSAVVLPPHVGIFVPQAWP